MTPAEQATQNAISFECKKDALQQRQSGDWKISFTVQGVDMDERITRAAMGTRFVAVLVEINDDELPVSPPPAKEKVAAPRPQSLPRQAGAKRDWREISPPQQAGIRCADPIFVAFLKEQFEEDWQEAAEDPAECVRLICGVTTRSQLLDGFHRVIWKQLDDKFQAWSRVDA